MYKHPQSSVVVVENKSKGRARRKTMSSLRRRVIVASVAGAAVLLAVVLCVVLGVSGHKGQNTPQPNSSQKTARSDNPLLDTSTQAANLASNGDYAGAQSALDSGISATSDAAEKGNLYQSKSNVAYNAGKYQDALEYAKKAEALGATQNTAYLIAISCEGLGDKQMALSYYHKALERATSESKRRSPDVVQMYRDKIKELE